MEIKNLIGSAAKNLTKKPVSGSGGCSSNNQELGGVVGGGAKFPPSAGGANAVGNGAPSVARPIGDISSISDEARTGGGGSSDLGSLKEMLAGLCQ